MKAFFDNTIATISQDFGSVIVDVIMSLVLLIIGLVIIGWLTRILRHIIDKTKMDATLKPFLISFINITLKVLLVVIAIQTAGIPGTTIVAVIGAASLAIGLAFQGALSNFAGGILILALRPFHVNDYIEVGGYQGKVEAIHVFNTILTTFDNKVISIPNGDLASKSIVNFTQKPTRRVDLKFGVAYSSDVAKVLEILQGLADNHPKVLKDPEPFVRLAEHGDSSLNFIVRVWSNTEDYWDVHFDLVRQVKEAFDQHKIEIPFPQLDVHLDK